MDTHHTAFSDDEIEFRLKSAAIEASRRNYAPGRLHSEVREEMLQKIAALDKKIATLTAK